MTVAIFLNLFFSRISSAWHKKKLRSWVDSSYFWKVSEALARQKYIDMGWTKTSLWTWRDFVLWRLTFFWLTYSITVGKFFLLILLFEARSKDPVKHSKSVVWKGVFRLIWTDRKLSFYQTQSKYWNPKIALAPHVNPSNKTIMRRKMRKSEQSSRVTQEKDHLPIACQHCISLEGRGGEGRSGLVWRGGWWGSV